MRGVEVPHHSAHVAGELCRVEIGFAVTGFYSPVCTDELDEIVYTLRGRWGRWNTGVPRSQETPPSWDPTVGLCLGLCSGPRGGAVSYERGTL